MKLRGIDFGNVLGGSGVQGFFGEGYWYHRVTKHVGGSFDGITFVAKTATLEPQGGNLPLKDNFRPKGLLPRAIRVKFRKGSVLNAISLSNPGLEALLRAGEWQKRTEPFFISVMTISEKPDQEMKKMVELIERYRGGFKAPFGIQINVSCPNSDCSLYKLYQYLEDVLEIAGKLHVPLMVKFGLEPDPTDIIMDLEENPYCDALCMINSIPFGSSLVDWQEAWGSDVSPLAKYGGGSLSGKPLFPLAVEMVGVARSLGFTKPINLGGGILCPEDVDLAYYAGASSVYISSAAILRFWRVQKIVRQANSPILI
ncbi:MAG: hypothetical protein Q7S53_04945 [bacterium]|nr:hypothetical protein [bacterium]